LQTWGSRRHGRGFGWGHLFRPPTWRSAALARRLAREETPIIGVWGCASRQTREQGHFRVSLEPRSPGVAAAAVAHDTDELRVEEPERERYKKPSRPPVGASRGKLDRDETPRSSQASLSCARWPRPRKRPVGGCTRQARSSRATQGAVRIRRVYSGGPDGDASWFSRVSGLPAANRAAGQGNWRSWDLLTAAASGDLCGLALTYVARWRAGLEQRRSSRGALEAWPSVPAAEVASRRAGRFRQEPRCVANTRHGHVS